MRNCGVESTSRPPEVKVTGTLEQLSRAARPITQYGTNHPESHGSSFPARTHRRIFAILFPHSECYVMAGQSGGVRNLYMAQYLYLRLRVSKKPATGRPHWPRGK